MSFLGCVQFLSGFPQIGDCCNLSFLHFPCDVVIGKHIVFPLASGSGRLNGTAVGLAMDAEHLPWPLPDDAVPLECVSGCQGESVK